jgi:imidazolonepropionase-like amidohydrolase
LVALNRRGMAPIEAIRAATVNAADLLGWQDRIGADRGRQVRRLDSCRR